MKPILLTLTLIAGLQGRAQDSSDRDSQMAWFGLHMLVKLCQFHEDSTRMGKWYRLSDDMLAYLDTMPRTQANILERARLLSKGKEFMDSGDFYYDRLEVIANEFDSLKKVAQKYLPAKTTAP